MRLRPLAWLGAATVLGIAACDEQSTQPIAPEFSRPGSTFACDFNALTSLINSYITDNAQKLKVQSLKGDMQTAWSANDTSTTQNRGFDIWREMGKGSGTGDPITGETLANGILKCMFFDLSDPNVVPQFPMPFSAPLTPSTGGAFYVRGGEVELGSLYQPDATTAALEAVGSTVVSGMLPQNNDWPTSFGERILVYGSLVNPADPGAGAHWAWLPANASASPPVIAALCNVGDDGTSMVHESGGFGFLPYNQPVADQICGSSKDLNFSLNDGRGLPFRLFARLASLGARLLEPQPLSAMTVAGSSVGGGTCCSKSLFTSKAVSVQINWVAPTPSKVKRDVPFTVRARAFDAGSTTGVNGVCAVIDWGTNFGAQNVISGPHECTPNDGPPSVITNVVSGLSGVADFSLTVSQTGALEISVGGFVEGRPDVDVTGDTFSTIVKTK